MRRVRHCHKVCSLFGTVSVLHHQGWTKYYSFVQEVKDNPYKFRCTICMRHVACDHQGKHIHMEKAMHQATVKQMKGQKTLGFHL